MVNDNSKEILTALLLLILLFLVLNPFGFLMLSGMQMLLLAILVIVFAFFAAFFWREKAQDEREAWHRMFAGRAAFLAGMAIVLLGIIIQSLKHNLDVWLIYTLGAMILAKILALGYSKKNN